MTRLDAAEYERGRTHLVEIAKALLPEGSTWRMEGIEWRADHAGGLSINTQTAAWFFFGSGIGGFSPFGLIAQLRPAYAGEAGVAWFTAYLEANPGTGSCTTEPADDAEEEGAPSPASMARAREILDTMVPVGGTPAEIYLYGRGIGGPPYPDCIGYLEDARCGEGALVAVLTAHERATGAQVRYLTPDGAPSLVKPYREQFRLERQPGAVFRLPPTSEALAGPRDPVTDYVTAEGIEDAMSLRLPDRPFMVLGLPGIATLAHLDLPKKSRLVHFEDGDAKDSPADRGCVRGIDHLLNSGIYVWTVPTPLELDANSILTEPNLGSETLRAMLRRARFGEAVWPPGLFQPSLSFAARVANLAKLDGTAFAQERAAIAKIFKADGVTISLVDAELKKHRPPKTPKPADAD